MSALTVRPRQGVLFVLPTVVEPPTVACSFGAHDDCDGFGEDDEPFDTLCGCPCHDEED